MDVSTLSKVFQSSGAIDSNEKSALLPTPGDWNLFKKPHLPCVYPAFSFNQQKYVLKVYPLISEKYVSYIISAYDRRGRYTSFRSSSPCLDSKEMQKAFTHKSSAKRCHFVRTRSQCCPRRTFLSVPESKPLLNNTSCWNPLHEERL